MKKIILSLMLLIQSIITIAAGGLTNNGSVPINVVMYGSKYIAPTATRSAQGRLNIQGSVINAGQNINFLPETTSIDIFYGNGNIPGIHYNVDTKHTYTISPGMKANDTWVITQDQD